MGLPSGSFSSVSPAITPGISGAWGAWYTLASATSFPIPLSGFWLYGYNAGNNGGVFRLGIGSTPSIILPMDLANANLVGPRYYPIPIPPNTEIQISVANQGTGTGPFYFTMIGNPNHADISDPSSYSSVVGLTNSSYGPAVTTVNTWLSLGTTLGLPTRFIRFYTLDNSTNFDLITYGIGSSASVVNPLVQNVLTASTLSAYVFSFYESHLSLPPSQDLWYQGNSTNIINTSAIVFY